MRFSLPCSAPCSSGSHCPAGLAAGFYLLPSRSHAPVGAGPPALQVTSEAALLEPRCRPRREPGSHRSAGHRHGGVKALSLTVLKTRVAWFVCTGCSSSPGVYHTFSSCLQNAVITNCKTSSSSDQSETSTALHVSSMSGLLSAPAGHTVMAQRCFSLGMLIWDLFFSCRLWACDSSW